MPLLMRDVSLWRALLKADEWLAEVGLAARAQHRQRNCPEGNSSAWRLRGRSSPSRRCCWQMNRPAILDEQNALAIMDLIERLHRTHRLTSILATHNPVLAARCDRVLRLEHGVAPAGRGIPTGPFTGDRGRSELTVFERYTEKARRVIFFARYEASQYGSPYIETEHLLLGLMREDKALANRFLRTQGSIESIRKEIEARITIRERISTSVEVPLSAECKRILNYGRRRSRAAGRTSTSAPNICCSESCAKKSALARKS